MTIQRRTGLGPILYGLLWAVLAPGLLVAWGVATAGLVPLPAPQAPLAGAVLASVGLLLMALGVSGLWLHGGGLPMNAYPPPRFVYRGVYRAVGHPIYVGFIALGAGASLAAGSASGLWLVIPVAALALLALVLGYERHDLRRRFGDVLPRPLFSLPAPGAGAPGGWDRTATQFLVVLPALLAYAIADAAGGWQDRFGPGLVAAWLLALASPLVVDSRTALRRFAHMAVLAVAATALAWLALAVPPAFHVLIAFVAADAWRGRGSPWGHFAWATAALVAIGDLVLGPEAFQILLAGLLFLPIRRYGETWEWLRRGAERVANSWREWRVGPVRVINHGFYTAAGGFAGTWIAGLLAGPGLLVPLVAVVTAALVLSALWAQKLEGSTALLRPLGYYGGIFGGLLATGAAALFGVAPLPLLGAIAVAMPWVQAAGRMRCLVQGCCHGGPASPRVGIRYFQSRSRVPRVAGLAGVPLHPTPLYSIITNVATGILLLRLWLLGAPVALVLGLYFILNAVARFVEESYRAEPQTPVRAGLRIYQWLALAGFLIGILFTTLGPATPPPMRDPSDAALLAGAALVALFAWLITGVDFPDSNRRFSRLADADEAPRRLDPVEPCADHEGVVGTLAYDRPRP
jgi:protein-S-isoprenylcysteine O-methyltransferase Ste14